MTNQEAIKVLREKISPCVFGEWKESVDMAISALQTHDVNDMNVGDTVSRQAAIDALLKEVRLVDGYYVENDEVIDKDDAIEAIRLLPPVTPKRKKWKWIIDGHHIVCSECETKMCNTDREGDSFPTNFCPNCGAEMNERE